MLFGMNDYLRENLSYFGLYKRMFQVKKKYKPESVSFGEHSYIVISLEGEEKRKFNLLTLEKEE